MKRLEPPPRATPAIRLRAATAVCQDKGISDTTLWRMGKRGWVLLVNVGGRCYVDLESLADFEERARKGEYAKPPCGAAAKSAATRAANSLRRRNETSKPGPS